VHRWAWDLLFLADTGAGAYSGNDQFLRWTPTDDIQVLLSADTLMDRGEPTPTKTLAVVSGRLFHDEHMLGPSIAITATVASITGIVAALLTIGLATVFWARRLGAVRVAVTASSHRREALAFEMGATAFVNPSDNLAAGVNEALGGAPDIVFEAVGKPGLLSKAVDLVRSRGTVVVLGLCTVADTYYPFQTMVKEVRIHPSMLYDLREFEMAADVLNAGLLAPRSMVTETVTLSGVPMAFEALKQRTTQCKTLIDAWAA
jgi:threonine dehydrogenase-like Zn-dependent dehydrogenase